MNEAQFQRLAAEGYNRIPVTLETFADLDTPLSIYLKLANKPHSYLLESVIGGERFGRYSIIGLQAKTLIKVTGGPNKTVTQVITDGAVIETDHGNPLDFIASYHARFKVFLQDGLPRFCGGLAGYFGYDTIRYIEPRLAKHSLPDEINTPDIQLMLTEELAVIDNLAGKLYLIVYANPQEPASYDTAEKRLNELLTSLDAPVGSDTDDLTVGDTIASSDATNDPIESTEKRQLGEAVERTLKDLPERDQEIVMMRFGIGKYVGQPHTLEDVAKIMKVTRERVRQIEQKTLARLRHPHNSANLRGFLDDN
jgi:anthranilate synthase component 1